MASGSSDRQPRSTRIVVRHHPLFLAFHHPLFLSILDRVEFTATCRALVEMKEQMCTECVSVLWAQGTERCHILLEYGLSFVAAKDVAVLERPKLNVHGTDAAPQDGSDWGRTAIAAFEAWGEEKKRKER